MYISNSVQIAITLRIDQYCRVTLPYWSAEITIFILFFYLIALLNMIDHSHIVSTNIRQKKEKTFRWPLGWGTKKGIL